MCHLKEHFSSWNFPLLLLPPPPSPPPPQRRRRRRRSKKIKDETGKNIWEKELLRIGSRIGWWIQAMDPIIITEWMRWRPGADGFPSRSFVYVNEGGTDGVHWFNHRRSAGLAAVAGASAPRPPARLPARPRPGDRRSSTAAHRLAQSKVSDYNRRIDLLLICSCLIDYISLLIGLDGINWR